jgi:hypothetical protein
MKAVGRTLYMGDLTITRSVPSQHTEIPFSRFEPGTVAFEVLCVRFSDVSWSSRYHECVFCEMGKEGYIDIPFKAQSDYVTTPSGNGPSADRQNVLRCILTSILGYGNEGASL